MRADDDNGGEAKKHLLGDNRLESGKCVFNLTYKYLHKIFKASFRFNLAACAVTFDCGTRKGCRRMLPWWWSECVCGMAEWQRLKTTATTAVPVPPRGRMCYYTGVGLALVNIEILRMCCRPTATLTIIVTMSICCVCGKCHPLPACNVCQICGVIGQARIRWRNRPR